MKYEASEQWDKAAEEFALAVTSSPKNPEYRLHLTRALFNASQMFIKKGTIAAQEKDYEVHTMRFAAHTLLIRQRFCKSEMDRMVRMQQSIMEPKPGTQTARLHRG